MAVKYTWSIDAHKHETSGNKYISNCSYKCTASESSYSAFVMGNVVLDRPSDSDMLDYETFLGSDDTKLVAAVKAKLGAKVVSEKETEANTLLTAQKTPTHVWTSGPAAK
tara:strand:+ start:3073 stop:3402 length:330 start_codon:yes stop_codon:yes gene_type:complete